MVAWVVPQLPAACFFDGDEVEGLADGLGGLSPLEQRLRGEAGGLDGGACAGGVDAGLFGGPEDLVVLLGARVEQRLHGTAGEVAVSCRSRRRSWR